MDFNIPSTTNEQTIRGNSEQTSLSIANAHLKDRGGDREGEGERQSERGDTETETQTDRDRRRQRE